jgi:hypothetical protein
VNVFLSDDKKLLRLKAVPGASLQDLDFNSRQIHQAE